MSLHGFLEAGKPVYESGPAARIAIKELPERERIYSHRFPGAHTESQIEGALEISIKLVGNQLERGKASTFIVSVDNGRTGHRMPTGSADLRALCLEVTLSSRTGWSMTVPAETGGAQTFDVLGQGPFDGKETSETGLAVGSRVYRSIFADQKGVPVVASYDAARVLFDNRLEAGEKRLENYSVRIPVSLDSDVVTLSAELYYLPYPRVFADRYKAPDPRSVLVTRFEQEYSVR